jgi:hypothetical protein
MGSSFSSLSPEAYGLDFIFPREIGWATGDKGKRKNFRLEFSLPKIRHAPVNGAGLAGARPVDVEKH